uniref:ER lumen protein-retaining receptor n=1 Tax=Calcidiscus leptoporus TaxID=127549 RepID=A0A7S0J8Z3_9EUKA|mmetsp:Transcript_45656/g.106493  ORF Transcript_45656/g.106493 Transcript_45656/m.106493 type:complete len:235 (+) Transcript_45656:66-770(+)
MAITTTISLAMNAFRLLGDFSHLLSFIVMFWKLFSSKSVAGISLKTQEIYVMVFLARYLDIFWNTLSVYNSVMKVIFIVSSVAIVYIIRFGNPHKNTYDKEDDGFPHMYLVLPAALLGIAVNQDMWSFNAYWAFEMSWAFSIYLEAVAILPQLFMLQKQGGAENLTSHYILLLGMYRLFYLLNWIYRYMTEDNYMQLIVWISGIVQTALYLDFFYTYINAKRERIDAPIELDNA